jgi:ABC-2 type transport system ATP-binding protein
MQLTPTIAARDLSKSFGPVRAVDGVSFDVHAGRVTGFIGRNGAGKTTTLRLLLGLMRPDAGDALINGAPFAAARRAGTNVGVVLDNGFHPARTALNHLRVCCDALGLDHRRAHDCLELVGLAGQAGHKAKALSMGQKQRLALAAAILAEPEILILDEPLNGLDPDGVRWLRRLLADYARQGRTVFLSSHILSELEQSVDDVVLIERTILWSGPACDFVATVEPGIVLATADDRAAIDALTRAGVEATTGPDELGVRVSHAVAASAEEVLSGIGMPLYERRAFTPRFEDAMYQFIDGRPAAQIEPQAVAAGGDR